MKKAYAKIADRERQARRRKRRLAEMTDAERATYETWLAAHRPGSAVERANDKWVRASFAKWRAEEADRATAKPEPDIFA